MNTNQPKESPMTEMPRGHFVMFLHHPTLPPVTANATSQQKRVVAAL